jgi:formylglycine-generating enzyme required for sulfatase activity
LRYTPVTGSNKVVRGGDWLGGWSWLRAAWRINYNPGGRSLVNGFRCASTTGR